MISNIYPCCLMTMHRIMHLILHLCKELLCRFGCSIIIKSRGVDILFSDKTYAQTNGFHEFVQANDQRILS